MRAQRNLTVCGRAAAVAIALLAAACEAPGEEASNVGEACVEGDLIAQCPPGSNPILGATASSMCEASASVDLVDDTGSVSGRCFGEGTCRVACQFASPCKCGVDAVTRDGVFCTPCNEASACGNGLCEGGETPESCPVDCNADCTPGEERCQATDRQVCNGRGRWELLTCEADTVCQPQAGALTACVRDDVFTGGQTGEPVPREDRVDGRIWFGDGAYPAEGTGTSVPSPAPPGLADDDDYVLEAVFFNGNQRGNFVSIRDFARAGYAYLAGAESETSTQWQKRLFPQDVEAGERLLLWGPKAAILLTLGGEDPPAGEPQALSAYPADMAGEPMDLRRGLTDYAAFSADAHRVFFARNYWTFSGQPHFTRGPDLLGFDGVTGAYGLVEKPNVFTLEVCPLAISADGRTTAAAVQVENAASHAVLLSRDGQPVRPLVPTRMGEPGFPLRALGVSANGQLLALQGDGTVEPPGQPVSCAGGVDLYETSSGRRIYTICETAGQGGWIVTRLLFSPEGDHLAIERAVSGRGGLNGPPLGVETWSLRDGKERAQIAVPMLQMAEYTPDGRTLATLALANARVQVSELALWDAETGASRRSILRWNEADPASLPDFAAFPDPRFAPEGGVPTVRWVSGFRFSPRGTRLLLWGVAGGRDDASTFVATLRLRSTLPPADAGAPGGAP